MRRSWHGGLHLLQTRPLRGGRGHGLASGAPEVGRRDHGVGVARRLPKEGLKAEPAVPNVARIHRERREGLVGHRLDGLVHRQQSDRVPGALLG